MQKIVCERLWDELNIVGRMRCKFIKYVERKNALLYSYYLYSFFCTARIA